MVCHHLSLTSFRRLLRGYGLVPQRLEAIDMGRQAIHNEASELLSQRLRSRIDIDLETAHRLLTLIHILMELDTPHRRIEREPKPSCPEAERTEHEMTGG